MMFVQPTMEHRPPKCRGGSIIVTCLSFRIRKGKRSVGRLYNRSVVA
jgi:hypothetical protein